MKHDRIRIDVRSKYGAESIAVFELQQWRAMGPLSRCLAIHEQCRDKLKGKPFSVLRERILPAR